MTEGLSESVAAQATILRCEAGSSVFGLNLGETADRDELGVCIEPPEYVVGLGTVELPRFGQWVGRSQPDGVRSGPGDLDVTVYSLRKWASLALKGNPSVLLLLFVPRDRCVVWTPAAVRLQGMASAFASKRAGAAFLGYMQQQRLSLTGERTKKVARPELVAAHGYDTKYAGHILRLGYQGIEYLTTGRISVPSPPEAREWVLACRRGELSLDAVLALAGELEVALKRAIDTSPLPDEPDRDAVNDFLIREYLDVWKRLYGWTSGL